MAASPTIERLQTTSALQEPVFRSRFPALGPLIARFRAAWNSISTKWYVRPLIAQQNEFNALVVDQLRSMAEQLDGMERRAAEQAARSAQLAERIGSQETRIHDLDARLIAQDREQSECIHDLAELRVQLVQMRRRLAQIEEQLTPGAEDRAGSRSA